ncbi:MAG: DUF4433 domain-containing protein, partial [Desulfovibrionaceae bacterium]|nr:DUF4433 domain-containing protein [Desulfovibrionaceae bacterium]
MADIYHFTHRDNLASILDAGGIHCDSVMAGAGYANVGKQDIKARRAQRPVPVPPHGVVADYVPFYFAPRSPMLYAIYKRNVPGCSYEQTEVVYLVAEAEEVFRACPSCFTDRNAVLRHAQFYADIAALPDAVDWPLMREKYWKNTSKDLERMERRMAEFLVHRFMPWSQVKRLVVYDQKNLDYIINI